MFEEFTLRKDLSNEIGGHRDIDAGFDPFWIVGNPRGSL
jgi:hypothetical protein